MEKDQVAQYEFTLAMEGRLDYEVLDRLYEAGCGDMTFSGGVRGPAYVDVTREASSFVEAVISAVRDIEKVPGLRVTALDADELVSLAEIADRLGRTHESVRLLAAGKRGPGGFPPPVLRLRDRTRLWLWAEVAEWANRVLSTQLDAGVAPLAPVVNAALRLRRGETLLSESDRRALMELLEAAG